MTKTHITFFKEDSQVKFCLEFTDDDLISVLLFIHALVAMTTMSVLQKDKNGSMHLFFTKLDKAKFFRKD